MPFNFRETKVLGLGRRINPTKHGQSTFERFDWNSLERLFEEGLHLDYQQHFSNDGALFE